MATSTWLSAVSADWTSAGNWTGGIPDAFTDAALISAAGTYTVGIAASESIAADAVTLDAPDATLNLAGTLSLGGASALLALDAGTLALHGTLQGGTVEAQGGALAVGAGALLDAVTWQGPLAVSALSTLNVSGGLTLRAAGGATPGTLDLTAATATLDLTDSETLDNVLINAGGTGGTDSIIEAGRNTLELGAAAVLRQRAGSVLVQALSIDNQGLIDAEGGDSTILGEPFTNAGTILALNNDTFDVGGLVGTLDNTGFMSIDTGSTMELNHLVNTGTIVIGGGGLLESYGQESLADYGSITNNGVLFIGGGDGNSFDLGGRTALSLCRCGASENKPLCDGSHKRTGFQSQVTARALPPPVPKPIPQV